MIYFYLIASLGASWYIIKKSKNKIITAIANIVSLLAMMLLAASILPESCVRTDCGQDYDKQGAYSSC